MLAAESAEPQAKAASKYRQLTFEEVSRHFDLPLTQAAERLQVCATLVKRICRENGVMRWPQRKLQSFKKRGLLTAVSTLV
ncbi:RWP-RK domain-containing protein, partial [Pavlovales sp. CCMP2436]